MNKFLTVAKNNYLLIIILLISFILRVYRLDYQSLWVDEIFTYIASKPTNSFAEIYQIIKSDGPHPPLYYYLVKITFHILGYTSFSLRFLSVVLGVLGIFAIYLLGKIINGKKLGLIIATLLCFNPFHIEYSQEGRMYSLLILVTILSFYYLIKYLQNRNTKSFIFYCLFSFLMIYTHLYGVFTLVAQYVIYAIFLFYTEREKIKNYIVNLVLGGIFLAIVYIPVFNFLIKNKDRNDSWIPIPTNDFLYQLIRDLFGKSDLIVSLVILFITYILYKSFEKKNAIKTEPITKNHSVIAFICILWILISILIPYYISIIKIPILVSRYVIHILPAILVLIGLSLQNISNDLMRKLMFSLIIVLSINQLFLIEKYYFKVNKSQFREISNYIIQNQNSRNDEYVSSLGIYYDAYLENQLNRKFIQNNLDEYITKIINKDEKIKPFWYADGHIFTYSPSPATEDFIKNNYIIEKEISLYGSWAKYFIPSSSYTPKIIQLDQLKSNQKYKAWIENFEIKEDKIIISGWGFLEGLNSQESTIDFILINNNEAYQLPTNLSRREDIVQHFGSTDYEFSGINSNVSIQIVPKNEYKIGIILKQQDKTAIFISDQTINLN